jgi:short-subunit dehydrogenase
VQRGKGAVVAISSSMHRLGAYKAPYGAEKAKMNALCNALHHELQGSGVTAQAMVLGAIITLGLASMMTHKTAAASAGGAVTAEGAAAAAAAGDGSSSTTDSPAALVSPFSNSSATPPHHHQQQQQQRQQ